VSNIYPFGPDHIAQDYIRSALTGEQLRRLEAASCLKFLRAGELIFKEGDQATHSAIVTSGVIKLSKAHPNNERYIIGLMFSGDLLGGTLRLRRTFSAEAATDLELYATPLEACRELFREAPELERALFQVSLMELENRHDWMFLLRGCSANQRVARFLLLLAKRAQPLADSVHGNELEPVHLPLPLTRGEIAGFLGLTIETVSRQMTSLKKRGVIELSGSREVIVPNIGLLGAHAVSGAAAQCVAGAEHDCSGSYHSEKTSANIASRIPARIIE
jgi:CRP/FNR family transcriptional regulator, anaerobic regulatory protein